MSGIINKVKEALHHDSSSTTTGHSTTGHSNTGHSTTGHSTTTGVPEGTAGPHSSRVANAADPRVDSDLDGSNRHTGTTGVGHSTHTGTGVGHTTHTGTHGTGVGHTGTTGTYGTAGHSTTSGVPEGTAGPHSSRVANAADPRVDSDLDGSNRHTGTTGVGHSTHTGTGVGHSTHTGTHGTGVGHTGTTGTYGTTSATGAGPHSSSLANKADPRVDSTTGSHTIGSSTTGTTGTHGTTHNTGHTTGLTGNTGTHGGISHSTNAGPHNSNLANKADPRVDSDLDGRGNRHGAATGGLVGASGSHATPGSGTAQNTAGPHNSDIANKLDPRVDSDLSGGKTLGGNATHA